MKCCSIRMVAGAALLLLALGPVAAHDHDHDHGSATVELSLNNGAKWVGDASLRLGMEQVRAALVADLPALRAGNATPERMAALAGKVNGAVAGMIQNCKLDPRTDAMAHLVLAEIMAGADALAHAKPGAAGGEGAERIVRALDNYRTYFEHPGWVGLK